jgi:hypothetical protein
MHYPAPEFEGAVQVTVFLIRLNDPLQTVHHGLSLSQPVAHRTDRNNELCLQYVSQLPQTRVKP